FGPNHNLMRFAVSPLDFVAPQVRYGAVTVAHYRDVVPATETFEGHLWIAVPALGVVLTATLVS
ncbi:MAG: hypothetical protein FWD97_10535, partial [Defluviitaleaceae bacterium]|nr:hypothetical protein [Defluviitaleaceae bacterium]